ncbi:MULTISPECIES: hypothetical protein [unclassified Thermosynechococcus]|uniref:hypothetical protein n=1 Tax=unclassified Thermosynechococcus TaxID=2622553 RepID=UPI001A0B325A|nr:MULTISPECIES: hypothetical protein [unclassified Thermosynechococcus]HIK34724.1 hypothetical protein [Thermosynechococcus sp. M98_K2018_005]HIK49175.1 hypothetical protein [Thermosynechococcus sp. M55_K2018_012]
MKIGELLLKAALINLGQLQVALREKDIYTHLRLGEILALHGWLSQGTIDFFVEEWPKLIQDKEKHPIGFYLKKAGLLTEEQIQQILKEQWQTSYRFGALAVLNGWVKQETVNFFLQYVNPNALQKSSRIERALGGNPGESKGTSQLHSFKPVQEPLKQDLIDPEDLAEFDLHFDEKHWLTPTKTPQRSPIKTRMRGQPMRG